MEEEKVEEKVEEKTLSKEQAVQIGGQVTQLFTEYDDISDRQKIIVKELRNLSIHLLNNIK